MIGSVNAADSVEQEPNFDQPQKPPISSSANRPSHQPLYATLAEYTLNSPRSFPIDTTNGNQASARRQSSPLKPIDEINQHQPGPFRGYAFPPPDQSPTKDKMNIVMAPSMSPTSSSTGLSSVPGPSAMGGTSMAQHRLSASGRPRRPSPLLHEIQPPSRRLSAHQMLLLTPFGGPLPAGALTGGGGMGMTRGSSSMGSGSAALNAPARLGSATGQSSGWPRKDSGQTTTSSNSTSASPSPATIGRELPSAQPQPLGRFPPRARFSLGHTVASHSPLASAPMTTIFSQGSSEGGSSQSREGSAQERERNQTFISREEVGIAAGVHEREGLLPVPPPVNLRQRQLSETVAMTRSNSLPVLTLRELQALKEKDGELGIQRGGDWAWVSRDAADDEEFGDERPPLESKDSTGSTASAALVTPLEHRDPFTTFHDPFATGSGSTTPLAAVISAHPFPGTYTPFATSSDYRYSPTGAEPRRMSDAPSVSKVSPSSQGGQRSVTDSRRPSAPNMLRQSFGGGITPRNQSVSSKASPPQAFSAHVPQPFFQPSYQPLAPPDDQSPHGSPAIGAPAAAVAGPSRPTRPPILRYKSSPARYTGLGLDIVVRPTTGGRAGGRSGSGSGSDQSVSGQSVGNNSRPGSFGEQSSPAVRGLPTMGHWAEVDFVDPLAATAEIAASSTVSSAIMSRTPSSISPTALIHRELPPSGRTSGSSGHHVSSAISVSARASIQSASSAPAEPTRSAFTIEHVTSRAHITEFESSPTFKGRSRFESVDSAFPLMPGGLGGRLSVPTPGAGEAYAHTPNTYASGVVVGTELSEGFPRRGSLGMGTFARLRKAMTPKSQHVALDKGMEVDEMGVPVASDGGAGLSAGSGPSHWSERRGSWAEGWDRGS